MSQVNVKDFGAVGDGSADDTVAFKEAIRRAIQSPWGGVVFIPTGVYRLTEPLNGRVDVDDGTYTIRPLTIRGEGKAHSRLLWKSTGGSGGLRLYGTGHSAENVTTVAVEGVSLSTDVDGAGTALSIDWIKPDGSPYAGHSPLVKVSITDTEITNFDYHGSGAGGAGIGKWTKGVTVNVPWGITLTNVFICVCAEIGVEITSPTTSCVHFLSGIYINNCDKALVVRGSARGSIEGFYLTNFEFVSNRIGIEVEHAGPSIAICNGHIDSASDSAQPALLMAFDGVSNLKIVNVSAWVHKSLAPTNLLFLHDCSAVSISGCTFTIVNSFPPSVNGVLLKNCRSVYLHGNYIDISTLGKAVLEEGSTTGTQIWP